MVKRLAADDVIEGELVEEPDLALVDKATREIRGILEKTLHEGLERVGQYVLRTFYGDSVEEYRSPDRTKKASLRLLVERCGSQELPVSKTFLSGAVRVAALARSLPKTSAYHRLPASHRVELARVQDPKVVNRLARDALVSKASTRAVRQLVAAELGATGSARGRPRAADPVKAVERAAASLRKGKTSFLAIKKADLDGLSDEQRERFRDALEDLLRLAKKLEALAS